MINAMVCGYYGQMNTGDDALMAATVWGVHRFLKAKNIVVPAYHIPCIVGKQNILQIFTDHQRFKGQNTINLYWNALKTKSVIFGGGSVFHSAEDLEQKRRLLSIAGRGPHAAVGVSLGPFKNSEDEKQCAKLLARISFLGLRDQESFDIAREIAPSIESKKTFDLALLLPRAYDISIDQFQMDTKRTGVGFALCNYERFTGGDLNHEVVRLQKVIKAIEHLNPDLIDEIVLIDFNGHSYLGDFELNSAIKSNISNFKVRHINYESDPISTLEHISKLKVLVSMRLHGSIFGYITKTPTIMISYHPKCIGWANQIGMDENCVMDSNLFHVDDLVSNIHNLIANNTQTYHLNPLEAEELAMRNWTWF